MLEETLTEEKNTDKILTGIAKSVVNVEAENQAEEACENQARSYLRAAKVRR